MTREAEAGVGVGGRGHSLGVPEAPGAGRRKTDPPPEPPEGGGPVILWSQTLAGRTIEESLSVVLSCLVCGHQLRPPQVTPTFCPLPVPLLPSTQQTRQRQAPSDVGPLCVPEAHGVLGGGHLSVLPDGGTGRRPALPYIC